MYLSLSGLHVCVVSSWDGFPLCGGVWAGTSIPYTLAFSSVDWGSESSESGLALVWGNRHPSVGELEQAIVAVDPAEQAIVAVEQAEKT